MDKIKIVIKTDRQGKALTKMLALRNAQTFIAGLLADSKLDKHPYDMLLMLHAISIQKLLNKKLHTERSRYTISLTLHEAEAFRLMWGRFNLDYQHAGGLHVQNLLNDINREM